MLKPEIILYFVTFVNRMCENAHYVEARTLKQGTDCDRQEF